MHLLIQTILYFIVYIALLTVLVTNKRVYGGHQLVHSLLPTVNRRQLLDVMAGYVKTLTGIRHKTLRLRRRLTSLCKLQITRWRFAARLSVELSSQVKPCGQSRDARR